MWSCTSTKLYNSIPSWDTLLPQRFWAIWLQRNTNLFNKKKDGISFANVINQATEYQFIIMNNNRVMRDHYTIQVERDPPPPHSTGRFKLNTDGSVKNSPGPGGIGGVIRNHNGDWKVGFITLRQGLLMAIDYNLMPLDINADSSQLITYLEHDNHHYTNLTLKCRSLMEKLGAAVPSHIFMEQNQVADKLSKEGHNCTTFGHPTFWTTPTTICKKTSVGRYPGNYVPKETKSSN
ncbi:hypothetical protein R3W88_021167 [Solanum pinnatisectum]|uniref:RNase H type-1 domain-containing protein n=1 Tax=Solanum pinnatisectum TaxID=50273 RepID=A0AAV9LUJ1_9SOLN|nr:hypothetical protein R3W88_021167 [Solanum pinnatisectum]